MIYIVLKLQKNDEIEKGQARPTNLNLNLYSYIVYQFWKFESKHRNAISTVDCVPSNGLEYMDSLLQ
jgi:hypothetical protein